MARRANGTNYTELAHHVLRDACAPLSLEQITASVQEREPIHAANPKALIQRIVEQSNLILPTRDGRYAYLPQLLEGNAFRQRLTADARRRGLVELSPDALVALWPGWTEARREREGRAAEIILPGGTQARLQRHFRLPGHWGFTASPEFWAWLAEEDAQPGDDLIIRVLDADAHRYAGELLRRDRRDEPAVAARNREVADKVVEVVRASGGEILVDRLAPLLIVAGAYRDPLPPDPLIAVLAGDGRFVDAGLGVVALSSEWTADDERLAEMRQQAMREALGEVRPRFRRGSQAAPEKEERATFARYDEAGRPSEAVTWVQRPNRIRRPIAIGGMTMGSMKPTAVIARFHEELNKPDLDAVMDLWSDDGILSVPPPAEPAEREVYRGRGQIRDWTRRILEEHYRIEASDVKISGDEVSWRARVFADRYRMLGASPAEEISWAVVRGGLIHSLDVTFAPETQRKLQTAPAVQH